MKPIIDILMLDIETRPMIAYLWDIRQKYISIDHIVQPGGTICWAAKWFGKDQVTFRSVYHHGHEKMVNDIYELLNKANAVVYYNGDKFDKPKLQQEFLLAGMTPNDPYDSIDLYPVVRKQFKFDSNKLDWICRQLGIGAKVQHKGMDLWTGCMNNSREDWALMREYNIQDVQLLEPLYRMLLPWIHKHPNLGLYIESDKPTCPACGSSDLKQSKHDYPTKVNTYKAMKCVTCGKISRFRKANARMNPDNILVGVNS